MHSDPPCLLPVWEGSTFCKEGLHPLPPLHPVINSTAATCWTHATLQTAAMLSPLSSQWNLKKTPCFSLYGHKTRKLNAQMKATTQPVTVRQEPCTWRRWVQALASLSGWQVLRSASALLTCVKMMQLDVKSERTQ